MMGGGGWRRTDARGEGGGMMGGGEWRQSRARGVAGWIENGVDGVDGVAAG